MRRRIPALLACLLVLGFSLSGWSRVCVSDGGRHATEAGMDAHGGGHHQSPSHSQHETSESGAGSECQAGYSCTGLSLEIAEADDIVDRPEPGDVMRVVQPAPAGQRPSLEPPPPKP